MTTTPDDQPSSGVGAPQHREISFVKLADLTARVALSGGGPPVLVLNGSGPGATIEALTPVLDRLSGSFRVACHDQRGLGQSGIPAGTWTMGDYARDAFELADVLGWSSFAVVGVSFGGMVALEMAASNPERLTSMVLFGTSPGGSAPSYPLHELAALPPAEARRVLDRLLDTRTRDRAVDAPQPSAARPMPSSSPGVARRLLGSMRSKLRGTGVGATAVAERRRGFDAQIEARRGHDVQGRLGGMRSPVLVGAGMYDELAPLGSSLALVEELPTSRLRLYPEGHFFFAGTAALDDAIAFLRGEDVGDASSPDGQAVHPVVARSLAEVADSLGFDGWTDGSVDDGGAALRVVALSAAGVDVARGATPDLLLEPTAAGDMGDVGARVAGLVVPTGSRIPQSARRTVPEVIELVVAQLVEEPTRSSSSIVLVDGGGSTAAGPLLPAAADIHLGERIARACRRHGSATALLEAEGTVVTYAQLLVAATSAAGILLEAGLEQGEVVALVADRGAPAIVGALGVLLAGGVYLPLATNTPPARRTRLVALAGARFICHPRTTLDGLDVEVLDGKPARLQSEAAVVMCTSGTTGTPKAVVMTHQGIARLIEETGPGALLATDVVANIAHASFDASLWEVWPALAKGASVAIFADDDVAQPSRFRRRLEVAGVRAAFVTTGLFNSMVRFDPQMFGSLRLLGVGGEALDPSSIKVMLDAGASPGIVFNGYGPTEATTFTTTYRIDAVPGGAVRLPIGEPIVGTTVAVRDGSGRLVPEGWPGELLIGGPALALGYAEHTSMSTERFVVEGAGGVDGRWYETGDLCVMSDGVLDYLGRLDRQLKVRGFRVDPAEIEAAALATGFVTAVAVVPIEGPSSTSLGLAGIPRGSTTTTALLEALRTTLPAYLVPSRCILVDELPLAITGKVDLERVAALVRGVGEDVDGTARRQTSAVDASDVDTAMSNLVQAGWAAVLGRTAPTDAPFDEVGGDSLALIELALWVSAASGIDVEVVEVALASSTAATVQAMAAALCEAGPAVSTRVGTHFVELQQGAGPTMWIMCLDVLQSPLGFAALSTEFAGEHRVMCSRGLMKDDGHPYRTIGSTSRGWARRLVAAGFSAGDLLLGVSGGGVQAADVARLLERHGAAPGAVVLVEPAVIDDVPFVSMVAPLLAGRDVATTVQRWRWLARWLRGERAAVDDGSWMWSLKWKLALHRLRRHHLDVPALVVIGERSPLAPRLQDAWQPWLAHASFIAVPGAHEGSDAVLAGPNVLATARAIRAQLGDMLRSA